MCERYLQVVQDMYQEFQKLGANWVALTSDEPQNVKKLADRCKFSFLLLSDPGGLVARSYGVLWDDEGDHNDPGVFLVRSDGILVYQSIVSGPLGRAPVADVLTAVRWESEAGVLETGARVSPVETS
ncbi:MAG: peroxiredoxin family protein [Dehalococcoidia bacterium]